MRSKDVVKYLGLFKRFYPTFCYVPCMASCRRHDYTETRTCIHDDICNVKRVKALGLAVTFREGVTPLDVIQAASIEGSARFGSDSLLLMTQKSMKSGDQGAY